MHGEIREGAAIGDGPLDAACKAISAVTRSAARLERYEIRAVTNGTEALGEATAQLAEGGWKVVGRGALTDVIEASAKAYLDGLNKLANLASKADGQGVRRGFMVTRLSAWLRRFLAETAS